MRLLPRAPVALWLANLAIEPDPDAIGGLSAAERERASRFVSPRDRRRYLAAHCALRQVLSEHNNVPACKLEFSFGRFGKPRLRGAPFCKFNLSDAGEVALIGLSDRYEVGVDVENLRNVPDAVALAEQHYTPAERRELAAAAAHHRDLAFLYGWTRKEACLKAIGTGLSIGPGTFGAGLSPDRRTVRIPTGSGIAFVHVDSFCWGAGVVGSYAFMP